MSNLDKYFRPPSEENDHPNRRLLIFPIWGIRVLSAKICGSEFFF